MENSISEMLKIDIDSAARLWERSPLSRREMSRPKARVGNFFRTQRKLCDVVRCLTVRYVLFREVDLISRPNSVNVLGIIFVHWEVTFLFKQGL